MKEIKLVGDERNRKISLGKEKIREKDYFCKIALLGDGGVGKTAIRRRFLGETFIQDYLLTIGADFAVKTIKNNEIAANSIFTLQIWDLAGQPRFAEVRKPYYRGVIGALVVFDITRPRTLANAVHWINELWKNSERGPVPFVLIGNKTDLRKKNKFPHFVDDVRGEKLANFFGREAKKRQNFSIDYLPTSAKTGDNIELAFEKLIGNIYSWIEPQIDMKGF